MPANNFSETREELEERYRAVTAALHAKRKDLKSSKFQKGNLIPKKLPFIVEESFLPSR